MAILGPLAVAAALPRDMLEGADWAVSLGEVVRMRRFWVMIVVAVSINICWHFLVNWIPTVLKDERGLDLHDGQLLERDPVPGGRCGQPGRRLALAVAGGTRPRRRSRAALRDGGLHRADHRRRRREPWRPTTSTAVVLLSVMAAGTAAFMANYFAFAQDVSSRHTGLVVGYLGGVANLFVAGFQPFAGMVKDTTGSFSLIFLLIGVAPLVGLAALVWGWRDGHGTGLSLENGDVTKASH